MDECHLFLAPVLMGGGTRALPDGVRLQMELLDERRFGSGVVHLHYGIAPGLVVRVGRAAEALVLARPPLALDALGG